MNLSPLAPRGNKRVPAASVRHGVAPLILIMPQGDEAYWVNWANKGPHWGDYVDRDLRRQVDATYRTLADAAHRAIGGLSMGGAGALQLAFNHPDIFGVVGAHSPALHVDDDTFSAIYGTGSTPARMIPGWTVMSCSSRTCRHAKSLLDRQPAALPAVL